MCCHSRVRKCSCSLPECNASLTMRRVSWLTNWQFLFFVPFVCKTESSNRTEHSALIDCLQTFALITWLQNSDKNCSRTVFVSQVTSTEPFGDTLDRFTVQPRCSAIELFYILPSEYFGKRSWRRLYSVQKVLSCCIHAQCKKRSFCTVYRSIGTST